MDWDWNYFARQSRDLLSITDERGIVYLASDPWVTGQVVHSSGGLML